MPKVETGTKWVVTYHGPAGLVRKEFSTQAAAESWVKLVGSANCSCHRE